MGLNTMYFFVYKENVFDIRICNYIETGVYVTYTVQ